MKKFFAAAIAAVITVPAFAGTVYHDKFNGNDDAQLTSLPATFKSGATTDFTYWGTTKNGDASQGSSAKPGDMDAGYFSVVNRAIDIHSQFVSTYDADNNPSGSYAVYNGFEGKDGISYNFKMTNLTAGVEYTFSANLIAIAIFPPYAQPSDIEFLQNGNSLAQFTINPTDSIGNGWRTLSKKFIAAGGTETFTIKSGGLTSTAGNDFGLDNVKITVVPLPTSALMGAGLLGVLAVRRMIVKA